jgi:hypothetical protein
MRFKVVSYSQSAHCCFDFTVVDTEEPVVIHGEHYRDPRTGDLQYEAVCECFTQENAKRVADALNEAVRLREPMR